MRDRSLILLILFSAILFSVGLGKMPLTDPDEVFYAETAREMLARGEVLTPRIFGEPQFEKPPIYYWMAMLSFKVFGENEFSARAPSALFGVLGVIGIYLLGSALVNRRAGFLSAIALATSVKYIILSRACVTDIVLTVFILYVFLFFFLRRYYLSALCLAFAVLTKGPIGVFLPAAILGIYLLLARDLKRLKEVPFVTGGILFLAVSVPWYFLMYRAHGMEFIDVFFGFHNIVRFLHPEHRIGDVFYYYVPIVLGGFFPWSIFFPLGIWQAFREKEERARKTNIFLVVWIAFIFLFFSASRTKLPTYVFPLYPALALLMGRALEVFSNNALTRAQKKCAGISAAMFLITLTGGIFAFYLLAKARYPLMMKAVILTGAAFIAFNAASVVMVLRKKYAPALGVFSAGFLVFGFLASYLISPPLGKYESSKHVSDRLLALAKPNEAIGAETDYTRGVAFYTGRENIPDIHKHDKMTKFFAREDRVWGVLKEKNYNFLYDDDNRLPFDKPTYIVYKLGKKVIATNKMPRDGKFLRMREKNATR